MAAVSPAAGTRRMQIRAPTRGREITSRDMTIRRQVRAARAVLPGAQMTRPLRGRRRDVGRRASSTAGPTKTRSRGQMQAMRWNPCHPAKCITTGLPATTGCPRRQAGPRLACAWARRRGGDVVSRSRYGRPVFAALVLVALAGIYLVAGRAHPAAAARQTAQQAAASSRAAVSSAVRVCPAAGLRRSDDGSCRSGRDASLGVGGQRGADPADARRQRHSWRGRRH